MATSEAKLTKEEKEVQKVLMDDIKKARTLCDRDQATKTYGTLCHACKQLNEVPVTTVGG